MNILIGGDFFVSDAFIHNISISEGLQGLFGSSDFNIMNLEGPAAEKNLQFRIQKTGPHIINDPEIFPVLKKLNIDLVTLANNHLMDYGPQGLSDTIRNCRQNSINTVGAGICLKEAQAPFIFEKGSVKLAVLNFAENEWASASDNDPGTNPLNIIENVRQIKRAKETCDLVLVIVHGGHEFYPLPNPQMVSLYRFYAESGASAVIGHHPHCISGYEVFQGTPVFYSLGNFLFTMRSSRDMWYTGLLLKLKINEDKGLEWDLIPVRQEKEIFALTLPGGIDKQNILSEVDKYSAIIADDNKLMERWKAFVGEWYNDKIDIFSPLQLFNNKKIIQLFQKSGLNRLFRTKKHYSQMLNHIRCESLSELTKSVFEKYLEM